MTLGSLFEKMKKNVKSTLKYLPGELLETTAKIGKYVPGVELAKGLGYTLASPYVQKIHEETEKRKNELSDVLIKEIKKARSIGNVKKTTRLKKAASYLDSPSVLESVMKEAPTKKQVIASSAELGLLASLGYKSFLPTGKLVAGGGLKTTTQLYRAGKAARLAGKLKGAGLGKRIAMKWAMPALKEAGIGAAFFGATKAREKDAEVEDIIKSAKTGAIFGAGISVGAKVAGVGIGAASKYIKPKVGSWWQKAMTGLEKIAAGVPKAGKGKSQLELTLSYIGEKPTFKQRIARGVLGGIQEVRKFKMRLIDRFDPLLRAEQRIAQATGRPLKEAEKVYRNARLIQSVADGKAEKLAVDYMNNINRYNKNIQNKATAWMSQLDFIDRAKLGQAVPGNQSLDDLVSGLKKLVKEIGPDDIKNVTKITEITHQYNDKLLQMRVDAGLISKGFANVLRKTHPNYIPHNVLLGIDEKVAQGLSQSFNVPKTDIMKAVGSAKNIKNPIVATVQRTPIATRVIEKNKLLTGLTNAQKQYNIFPGMKELAPVKTRITVRTTLKSGKTKLIQRVVDKIPKPQAGFDTINLFRNGIKETWQVPGDIAVAIKNLDTPLTPKWFRIFTLPQKILKKGATQYNLSFALPNKFRDKQTAALTARAFMEEMANKTGVSPKSLNLTAKQIKELYKTSGGYGASIFREGEETIWKNFQKLGVAKKASYLNPAKLVNTVNDSIETSTRLGVFKQALSRGLSPKDAAFVSRNATIDFAKMGTWMKPANQAIPFLNARVQGFINLPKALVASPEAFVRMQAYTAAYPTLLLHQHC